MPSQFQQGDLMVQTQGKVQVAQQSGRMQDLWMYVDDSDCPVFLFIVLPRHSKRIEFWPLLVELFSRSGIQAYAPLGSMS